MTKLPPIPQATSQLITFQPKEFQSLNSWVLMTRIITSWRLITVCIVLSGTPVNLSTTLLFCNHYHRHMLQGRPNLCSAKGGIYSIHMQAWLIIIWLSTQRIWLVCKELILIRQISTPKHGLIFRTVQVPFHSSYIKCHYCRTQIFFLWFTELFWCTPLLTTSLAIPTLLTTLFQTLSTVLINANQDGPVKTALCWFALDL